MSERSVCMMEKKNLLLIVNPKAGKRMAQGSLCDIVDLLTRGGYQVTVHVTQSRGDAAQQAREAEKHFDRVVCCGGDGTLNEMVSGVVLWNTRPECGYIPAGTTNDFASTLGFPKSPKEAAVVAAEGKLFHCDIGQFDERFFVYIAAFGAFTSVAYTTDQQAKNIFGRLAYLFQGAKELSTLQQGHHMRVITDQGIIEDDFIFGGVSNSLSIGGLKNLPTENIFLDDGWLELLLIRQPKSAAELSELAAKLLSQQFDQEMIRFVKVKSATFSCDHPVAWTLDGEDGGTRQEVTVECLPGAVTFAVPMEIHENK